LVTLDSIFDGPVHRVGRDLVINGKNECCSVASTSIMLRKQTRYRVTVQASGDPELHLDFWGASGKYDDVEREVQLTAGPKTGSHRFTIDSGDAPEEPVSFRLFFLDKRPIRIENVLLEEVQFSVPQWTLLLIWAFAVALVLLFALRYRDRPVIWAAGVGLVVTAVYFAVPIPQTANVGDNFWYVPTSESLLRDHDLELSEYKNTFGVPPHDWRIKQTERGFYSVFPFGTSLIAAPLVFLGRNFTGDHDSEPDRSLFLAAFTGRLLAGLAAGIMYLVLLHLTGGRRLVGLLLSACFAFYTSQLSIHAGGLWSHNAASLLLCVALYLLVAAQGRLVAFVAPVLVLACVVRPDSTIWALAITAYIIWCHRTSFLAYCSLFALSSLIFFAYCYTTFGIPVPEYYRGGGMTGEHLWEALIGNLLSPNRGLFVFTPIALFSVYGMYLAFRKWQPLYTCLAVGAILHWISISMFRHWWAGYSYGPRFFALLTPLLIVLLVPVQDAFREMSRRARVIVLVLFCLTASWSLFVHIRGATSWETHLWNSNPNVDEHPERIWDWTDWQPLRGL